MRAVSMPPAVHALWRALAGNPVASGSLAVLVGGAGIALLVAPLDCLHKTWFQGQPTKRLINTLIEYKVFTQRKQFTI